MNETDIYQLLIGRDRRRCVVSGIFGVLFITGAAIIDTIAHNRLLAILVGLPGIVLLFDHVRHRSREPLAKRAASQPQSVVSAQHDARMALFLRFADGYALAPNISELDASRVVEWLKTQNPELKSDFQSPNDGTPS